MKFSVIAIILMCLILTNTSINGQNLKKRTADRYYDQLAYIQAVDFYKDLVNKKQVVEEDLRRLSYSYYQLSDYKNAEFYYRQLNQRFNSTITETDLLNYLQVLKYNKNYKDASIIIEKIKDKNIKHKVAINHINNPNYNIDLKLDSSNYTITNVKSINTENSEICPVFIKNNSVITFASNRKNKAIINKTFAWDNSYFMDLWQGEKNDSCTFQNVIVLPKKMTSLYHDGPISLSSNEKIIYLTRSNFIDKKKGTSSMKIINLKLYIIILDSLTGKWGEPISFEYNSDEYSIGHATITKDGKFLYFVSDMPGGFGQTDLYVCENKNGKWQKPENLGQTINTEGREMFPYVYEDGTLFFSSDGRAGLGGLDLYFSPFNLDKYFEPQNLGFPLNSNMDDFGFFLNKDLMTGYLSSNRIEGKGKDDIYFFRSKNTIIGSIITGVVYDENTKEILPNATVYLVNSANTQILDTTTADETGRYKFNINNITINYKIAAREPSKYYDKVIEIKNLFPGDNIKDIYLFPKYKLLCKITDAKTDLPLEGTDITIVSKSKNTKKTYKTDSNGELMDVIKNMKIGNKINFSIKLEKKGYVSTIQDYEIILDTNTIVNLNDKINCKMQKMELGSDISKAIKINPIYFDLAKYDIKPISAIELDKIVLIMKENPTMTIELGSHTDCRSSFLSNMKLSEKRAKASANYIISKGIDVSRIVGRGYGESKLINKCECEGEKIFPCTEDEHQINRRTEFIITKF